MHSRRVSPLTLDMMCVFQTAAHTTVKEWQASWPIRRLIVLGRHPISCAVVPEAHVLLSLLRLLLCSKGTAQQCLLERETHNYLSYSDSL